MGLLQVWQVPVCKHISLLAILAYTAHVYSGCFGEKHVPNVLVSSQIGLWSLRDFWMKPPEHYGDMFSVPCFLLGHNRRPLSGILSLCETPERLCGFL